MNALVTLVNGGVMPVAARDYIGTSTWRRISDMKNPRLLFLSDRIPVGPARMSIGDVVLLGSIFFRITYERI